MPSKSPPCVVRASSACPPLAQIARHAAGPTRPGLAAREARSTRRRTTKQRIHSQHVPSRSSPVPVCAASACPLPAWVARHAADTTRPVLAARVTSKGHRRMIRQRAQHGHQASGREDDARRRREERVSTVHDGADGREPRNGKRGDVLLISVATSRLSSAWRPRCHWCSRLASTGGARLYGPSPGPCLAQLVRSRLPSAPPSSRRRPTALDGSKSWQNRGFVELN